jgi:glycosyltransferase involved in cell wall biosynthesis
MQGPDTLTISPTPHSVLRERTSSQAAQVSICISLYNYEKHILETLESIYKQTLSCLDLIIVDDGSRDQSADLAQQWLESKQSRFNKVVLVQHRHNSGLASARNTALCFVTSPYVMILDADNHLYPYCIERCLEAIEAAKVEFAYPLIEKFGDVSGVMGNLVWSKQRLAQENYIDAMALLNRAALLSVGGYSHMSVTGWEDYDLWCKFVEQGYEGVLVPEILARYRVHSSSMLNRTTHQRQNVLRLHEDMKQRHPWLQLNSQI